MKKIIISALLMLVLIAPGISRETKVDCIKKEVEFQVPEEVWREYVCVDDIWYVIIHYSDSSIGVYPLTGTTPD